jgi:hypothetical protein
VCLRSRINAIRHYTLELLWPYGRAPIAKKVARDGDYHHQWQQLWTVISSMEGLQVLIVHLGTDSLYVNEWREHEVALLEPVKRVTRPERFELTLTWPSRQQRDLEERRWPAVEDRRPLEGMPCVIKRDFRFSAF